VYDEIGKKIYSVVFERRRYALRGKKARLRLFCDDQKRQISPFQIFCGATKGVLWEEAVFFPFSLPSLFSLSFL
jgi:hypothetical protein